MFSSRGAQQREPNRMARALSALHAAEAQLLDLTQSNPTLAQLGGPRAAAMEALSSVRPERYTPDPLGLPAARQALAEFLSARGTALGREQLCLTCSTSEAYGLLLKLLCDPDDEVLVPSPSYPLLEHLCRLEGVRYRPYPLRYDGRWHMDTGALAQAVGKRTRAIVVINPNNPTGNFVTPQELRALERTGLPVVSDEVFLGFPATDAHSRSALAGAAPTFVLGGLSKSLGLPQLKLSWIGVTGDAAWVQQAIAQLGLIADTYLSLATAVQLALPALLQLEPALGGAIRGRLADNAAWLDSAVQDHPSIDLLHREAGFYAILRVPETRSDEDWALLLLQEDRVHVQPGYFYDLPAGAHLVISLLTEPTTFRAGVERVLSRVSASAGA